ncbi:MAG: SRPBCC domain-containing protein [Acidobacteria bacterium]|nr:SRPBCC domain-containing protein [Acidobacteriota bacterium]
MPICEIDLRVGGGYRFLWRNETDGSEMGMRGEYREIVPSEKLVSTEKFDEAWYPGTAVNTLTFSEQNGVTVMTTMTEYDSAATRDAVMRSPMESGVRASYNRMEKMLERER